MYLNTVNYHSICMTDFFLPLISTPLPQFLKLRISRPAAVYSVMFEKSVNEDTRTV